jgi:hypothetical protein
MVACIDGYQTKRVCSEMVSGQVAVHFATVPWATVLYFNTTVV